MFIKNGGSPKSAECPPMGVIATLSFDCSTPIRSDTQAGLASQGLMGAPSITLHGARPPRRANSTGGALMLKADLAASQDLRQGAGGALRRLDTLIADNTEPLHGILPISTPSQKLSRAIPAASTRSWKPLSASAAEGPPKPRPGFTTCQRCMSSHLSIRLRAVS